MRKTKQLIYILLTICVSALSCTNTLRIRINKPRSEKTILRDINKYKLDGLNHYMASNVYVENYFKFKDQNIAVSPVDYANFCLFFNKDGYLLKEKKPLVCNSGGCSSNPYGLLHRLKKDSTFNLSDDNLIEIDSNFNIIDYVNRNEIYAFNDSLELNFEDNDYLAILHWGVFCNCFNKNTKYNMKYLSNLNLPIKTIYLNVDFKK
ncbi:MAG: hypothetical protein PF448_01160 [Bacteroidales bacterium]|jgi:hypothetical protein|nr:hypothetical protein [Bacteroidales bacterium]